MFRNNPLSIRALALLLAAAVPFAVSTQAAAQDGDTAGDQSATKAPDVVIKDAVSTVRSLISENAETYRSDSEAFYAMIEREIVPHFDMPYIARLTLGRHARGASPDQRRRFATAFKDTLMRTYADAMLEYNSAVETEFLPLRAADDAERVTVETRLVVEEGDPIPVGFVMHQVDGDWLIYDISVEGISLITNFRAQFNQRIRESGLDKLIERLEAGQISTDAPGASGGD